jgi:hypothetical protein
MELDDSPLLENAHDAEGAKHQTDSYRKPSHVRNHHEAAYDHDDQPPADEGKS